MKPSRPTQRLLLLLPLALAALAACKKDLVCPQGEADCGGRCVAIQTDAENCGACGFQCGAGVACEAGACVCPPGTDACGGGCFDLASAPDHCGACAGAAAVCAQDQVCSGGACGATCAAGLTECDRACVDTGTDRNHCGACGNACRAGESCVDGACASIQVACFATNDVRPIGPDLWSRGPARATGAGPIALALVGDELWAANSLSHSLSRFPLDPSLPGTEEPVTGADDFEAVQPYAGMLLVSNSGRGTLLAYDPATSSVVDEIELGSASSYPHGIAVSGGRAFVALYGKDASSGGQGIAVVDLSGTPDCAAPGSNVRCGVMESTIDLRSSSAAYDAPGLPFPTGAVAVDGRVFVTLANMKPATSGPYAGYYTDPAGPSRLAVVDTTAGDALSIVSLGACEDAGAIAYDGTRLWISCGGATPGLLPVSLASGTPTPGDLTSVALGAPGNLAFCHGMGYVTDLWSGQVLRFDPTGVEDPVTASVCPYTSGDFPWAWAADVACTP